MPAAERPLHTVNRPSRWRLSLLQRLGFEFECVGQGFGSYWAWVGYFRLLGWRIHLERYYCGQYDLKYK